MNAKLLEKLQNEVNTREEIWKSIPDYRGLYEVSSFGRVRSLNRTVYRKDNRTASLVGKIMSPGIDRKGYYRLPLCKNSIQRTHKVHRLVAQVFIPNPDNLPEVNHIDTVKSHNWIENLEWVTTQSNIAHAVANGLYNNRLQKFTDETIIAVYNSKDRYKVISDRYGISTATIGDIRSGRRWTHITDTIKTKG
jgi:NUMOD4 motif/HNH endonuclease